MGTKRKREVSAFAVLGWLTIVALGSLLVVGVGGKLGTGAPYFGVPRDYAAAQTIEMVSVSSGGVPGNGRSFDPSVNEDGRYVTFTSEATNLVAGDSNAKTDVFVRDRAACQTSRVSVATDGAQGNSSSGVPSISADGRYVAFQSYASNLVPDDTNGQSDAFVHDRQTGQTTRVSVSSTGEQGNSESAEPSISANGRYVTFRSWASNLVDGDSNGNDDIFVHNRLTGSTRRVTDTQRDADDRTSCCRCSSGATAEGEGTGHDKLTPTITDNGALVACAAQRTEYDWSCCVYYGYDRSHRGITDSWLCVYDRSSALVESITTPDVEREPALDAAGAVLAYSRWDSAVTGSYGIDLCDVAGGTITSIAPPGSAQPSIDRAARYVAYASNAATIVPDDTNEFADIFVYDTLGRTTRVSATRSTEANGHSADPSISGDGRIVAFETLSDNLVTGDTNGVLDVCLASMRHTDKPTLSCLGTAGYEADGVNPDQGAGGDTRFRFKVLYSDADGHGPRYVSLHLRRNGKPFWEFTMVRGVGDYTSGRVYRRTRKLPPGNYEHCFKARDRDGLATGEATQWAPGPVVGPRTVVALTSLAAVPTNAGTQITFSLSSAAQVQARVLNVAGRPVKTLCHAKDCEAGTNTLLWNAQSDTGLRVPNGTYLVELAAKTGDGSQARRLGQVRVSR